MSEFSVADIIRLEMIVDQLADALVIMADDNLANEIRNITAIVDAVDLAREIIAAREAGR